MTDHEKPGRLRRDLDEMRRDLSLRIAGDAPGKAEPMILHDRVGRAIRALSPRAERRPA